MIPVKKASPWEGGRRESVLSDRLIEECQGLVRSLAWKICQKLPPSVDVEDLISWGQVGLAEAARGFDPSRGHRFTTYAYHRIRGAILDGLAKMGWSGRRSRGLRADRMASEVLHLDGVQGSDGDRRTLDEGLRWFRVITNSLAMTYLVAGSRGDDGGVEADIVDTSAPSPPDQAVQEEVQDKLHALIDALPLDAGSLIHALYYDGLTLEEAGGRIGISKAWACRLHARTLQRLARSLQLLGMGD